MSDYTVADWAVEWLNTQREKGEKCLEIKISNGNHYVYNSTSVYDSEKKGARKKSFYIGTLKLIDGRAVFTPKKRNNRKRETGSRSIRETGPLRLLDMCADTIPKHMQHRFPTEWDSAYALSLLRCIDNVPLKRAADLWDKYEPVRKMAPPTSENTLADVLERVGRDRKAQTLFFKDTMPDGCEIAFDLTEIFSTSGELTLAEKGRNPEHDDRNQVNIAMACTLDTGEPSYIRALPGSVRDVKALCSSLRELKKPGLILVADRGLYSKDNIGEILKSGMDFAIPVKRDSTYYGDVSVGETDFFFWREKVIRHGKTKIDDGLFLYRFLNDEMAMSEDREFLKKVKDGKMSLDAYIKARSRFGHMVVVSSLDRDPEWIYGLYKRRDKVEKRFRTLFSIMDSDAAYLRNDDRLRGHIFIAYLSLKILSRLEARIHDAGLSDSTSVEDVLLAYSKAYAVSYESGEVDYEVPKKTEDLDSALGFNIFPILRS